MNKGKIVFVIPKLIFGGIENQVFNLVCKLKDRGYDVLIIALDQDYNLAFVQLLNVNNIQWEVVEWMNFRPRIIPKFLFKSIYFNLKLRSRNPYFIFSYTRDISFYINLTWQLSKAKRSFFMERGGANNYLHRKNSVWTKMSMKNASLVIFNSAHARDKISDLLGLEIAESIVIKNGLHTPNDLFCEEDSFSKLVFDRIKSNYVLMVANFFPGKRQDILINFWKSTNDSLTKPWLVLIGKLFDNVEEGFIDYGNKIVFFGERKDRFFWIYNSLFCVLSSDSEGCPNALIEYILLKKLAIVSNIEGCLEIIPSKFHDNLVFSNTIESFGRSYSYAMNNYGNKFIIDECYECVAKEYSMNRMVSRYLDLFHIGHSQVMDQS